MGKMRTIAMIGGVTVLWIAATGCTSLDEYNRVNYALRQANAHRDEVERDLGDERARSRSLESERDSLMRELDTKTALAETLQAENGRLDSIRASLQGQLDEVLAQGLGDIQVVEIKLPAELDRALQDFAAQFPNTIEYDAKRGAVRWKSDLTFALGSDVVRDSIRNSLAKFSEIVNSTAAEPFEIVVVGHTDNVAIGAQTAKKHPTNWHLSAHRAVSVMFALNQYGINFDRLACMGYGEYRPRKPNPARGGCEANRRVEIFLVGRGDRPEGADTASAIAQVEPD